MYDFSVFTGLSVFAGDEDIDDFLLHDARIHYDRKMAVTYVLRMCEDDEILAFATLQNDAVKIRGMDEFPYQSFPAVKIGRLGVAQCYQRKGIGSFLIDMIARFMCHDNRTGCRYITLDAYNKEETLSFYRKNGFILLKEFPDMASRRTLPMYRDLMGE